MEYKYETKKQRLKVYKDILKEATRDETDITMRGLCLAIRDKCGIAIYDNNGELFEKKLPELYAQKPKTVCESDDRYWWAPGEWQPRIEALMNAIKMIEGE
jgi:hypothetical protein